MLRVVLLILVFMSFESVAGRLIESVTLTPNPAAVNTTVSAEISVLGTGVGSDRRWYSTGYRVNGGNEICENHENYESSSSQSTSFELSGIGNSPATYQIDFVAYRNNSCGGGGSNTYSTDLTVVTELFDISLSPDTILDTDAYVNQVVGDLELVDATGAVIASSISLHSYDGGTVSGSCIAGAGDNWRFSITNNVLSIGNASGSTLPVGAYTICVRTGDLNYRENLTIYVEENTAGVTTEISLSNDMVYDYESYQGVEIGELTVVDPNSSSIVTLHTYDGGTLAGNCALGQDDNWRFTITDNTLSIGNASSTFLPVGEYVICVKTSDDYYRQNLTIQVEEPAEEPIFFVISNDTINLSNIAPDAAIGDFITTDDSKNLTFGTSAIHYSNEDVQVGQCESDADNHYFYVSGNTLHLQSWASASLVARTYKICIKGEDPNGIRYLRSFDIGVVDDLSATFLDKFNVQSYDNNDGEVAWSGSWREPYEEGSTTSGKVRITNNRLHLVGSESFIYRELNLSGYSEAYLSFDYEMNTSGSDDDVYIIGRKDNTNTWTILYTLDGGSDYQGSAEAINLTAFIASDVDIGIYTASGFDNDDDVYIDNIAIDAYAAGTCPDTSAYDLIFEDDFSADTNQWQTVNLDRSRVNLWPGESVYSNSENQLVQYAIQNGKMDINGSVTAQGDNEYGLVIHDMGANDGAETYHISTRFTSNSSGSTNNDAGLVFGYSDDENFYLLRWTKYAQGYANNTTFPGEHRSLDLIKVENATVTILDSRSNYYDDDDINLAVTVNEDGISICTNGTQSLNAPNEQPVIGQVGFFSYDNDIGISFDDFQVYCSDCAGIIGWWPMEGDFTDLVQGNDLTAIGSPSYSTNEIAKTVGELSTCRYAEFDGSTYGQVQDSGTLNSDELTVSAWVYPTSYPTDENDNNGNDSLMAISSKDENYEFHINANGNLYWWWRNTSGGTRTLTSSSTIPLNTWTHVAISYQPGSQSMYIDGVLVASSAHNESPFQSTCDYFIGADVATGSCSVLPARTFIGKLDEVRIYSKSLSQQEIIDDTNLLRNCQFVEPSVHHYEIIHDTTGLTCLSESVTVVACADASCSYRQNTQVTGALIIDGSIDQSLPLNFANGAQQLTFNNSNAEAVTLSIAGSTTPSADFGTNCSGANCQIFFADSGYIVNAPDFLSASGMQQVTVQAVKTDEITQSCIPDYVGSKPVNIDFSYVTPNQENVSNEASLQFSATSGGTTTDIVSGTGVNTNLDFSSADASTSFYIGYEDVGQLSLTVSDQNNVLIAGSDDFLVYPLTLVVKMTDSDGLTLGGTGNFTHIAAQAFNLNIHAINAKGVKTANYRAGEPDLASIMAVPTIAGGANPVQLSYDGTNTVTSADSLSWQDVTLTFDGNGFTSSAATYNNVGVFALMARDTNYFGRAINMYKPVSTGRFIPAYFAIENLTTNSIDNISTPEVELALQNSSGNFSYVGENIDFASTPTFQYQARTYTNQLATNYVFNMNNFDFDEASYVNNSTTADIGDSSLNLPSTVMTVTDATAFDGFVDFVLNNAFSYSKGVNPSEPITMLLDLDFAIADLQDSDGVGYDSDGINNNDQAVFEDYQMAISGAEVRYGRLAIDNAFGPDNKRIRLNVSTEYYIDGRFVLNEDDSTSNFSNLLGDISVISGAEDYEMSVDNNIFTTFNAGTIAPPYGLFVGLEDNNGPNEAAELLLELTNAPSHLLFDWDGDGVLDQPSATILFGRFKGNDRIIYKRER